jgi:hypothetical protein
MLTTPDQTDAVTSPATPAPVGPHPQGFYRDCDPPTGRAGTIYRAEDFNELIQNLRAIVFQAAAVAPTKGAATMLRDALHRLYAGHATQVVATQTLTADQAGLVMVDATTADVTLTLPKANVLPGGSPVFAFVRLDATTNRIRIVPAAGDQIRDGVIVLETDPAMIRSDGLIQWFSLLPTAQRIKRNTTLNVSPTGSATPADPTGGDAFDTLDRALQWLGRRAIDAAAVVTVQLAAGTYTRTTPINVQHPNGSQIKITGVSSATTTLQFNACHGFVGTGTWPTLAKLRIHGDKAGTGRSGLAINANANVFLSDDVLIDNFSGNGIFLDVGGTVFIATSLTVRQTTDSGILVGYGSVLNAGSASVTIEDSGGYANLLVYGSAQFNGILTRRGPRGIAVQSGGGYLLANTLQILDPTTTSRAMEVAFGAVARAGTRGGLWEARMEAAPATAYTFYAGDSGFIRGENCITPANVAITSPAVNTLGNVQGFIQSG